MKKYLLITFLGLTTLAWAQETNSGPVKWMTFEEALEKSKTEKRKIFIDVYTDWCGWCKVMDKSTFTEEHVAKILNEEFYPVKFNAEQRADIIFDSHTFKFVPYGNGGTHQLAMALLNNKMSYPTVVFLNEDFAMLQPVPGYKKPEEFHQYLVFYGENYFKKGDKANEEFQKNYKSPYTTAGSGNGGGK